MARPRLKNRKQIGSGLDPSFKKMWLSYGHKKMTLNKKIADTNITKLLTNCKLMSESKGSGEGGGGQACLYVVEKLHCLPKVIVFLNDLHV